jgi:hypothetical protein
VSDAGEARKNMATGIGAASDFYRIRVTRLTEGDAPEFEWREDILWREPVAPVEEPDIVNHRVEVVALDDDENVTVIGIFDSMRDATEAFETASEDMNALTRSEFEDRYFPA